MDIVRKLPEHTQDSANVSGQEGMRKLSAASSPVPQEIDTGAGKYLL
jgi:hypothetical protein